MPSKKKSNVEILPPDIPTRKQIVTARHTKVYEVPEVVEVPIEDDEDEAPAIEEEQERRQRQPSFRTKIRENFKARGIGADETLFLRIDRLPLFAQNGMAGPKADKEFCGIIQCTEKFFDDDDEYLTEIQRRYGPGEYWLTLRHKAIIIKSWRERLGGFTVTPVIASSEPGQPPQIIYQQPMGQAQPQRNLKEELRDVAEMIKLVDNIRGPREENPAPVNARTEDEVLATAILKQPDVIENVVGSVIKRFGGKGGSDEPWYAEPVKDAVKSGQAAQLIKTTIDSIFNGFRGLFPNWMNNNGQTQIPQTQVQNAQGQVGGQAVTQGIETGQPRAIESVGQANPQTYGEASSTAPQSLSPENQALNLVIDHCSRKVSPKITYAELIQMEQRLDAMLNQHAMATGQILTNQIALYLDILADMTPDEAIEVVKTIPNGEQVASLPHAKSWTESLQKLIKESQEGDDDE